MAARLAVLTRTRMPQIRKILFPVDFSDSSFGAARYVEYFAGQFQAEIMLLHAVGMGEHNLAEELLPGTGAGGFNQALMELGALVCTPTNPRCGACPMRRVCAAQARGLVRQLPNRGDRPRTVQVVARAAFVRHGRRILLRRRSPHGLLANFWALPSANARQFRVGRRLHELRHAITHRRILLRVHECAPVTKLPSNRKWRWVTRRVLNELALPAAHRRAIEHVWSAPNKKKHKRPAGFTTETQSS